ncbi:MAG: sugar isomerase [Cellulomonas sp. 73-145]|uniref:D-sedoheptulose-7-phosphate isomerase n=1 Tax=unclassified Cellulomonas TaxID=2620175 RepID=UPI000927876C|nr:SIS domain-containing protein [Cellulomonas sp. 73-145]MBN9328505.1 SIS domain-containing protein [Cellulomonas sp.]OJV59630.1 MAG: sugar isomerase [Cellulomonas sp. 73-145]
MSDLLTDQLQDHVAAATALVGLADQVHVVADLLCATFARGGFLYAFGNGGSAADAQHLVGELVGHYKRDRRPLPAVTLSTDPSSMTCIANDYAFDEVFSRQVEALARPGDLVVGFTTSGRSPNVVRALATGRDRGATTLLFAGGDGGPAAALADHVLLAPSHETPRIQEMHTVMLHVISEVADSWAAGSGASR